MALYHYDTYREELGKAYPGFGHALWEPNPGEYPAVEVGDVGFIRDGTFHRLFSVLQDGDHWSNQSRGVPEYHEQLQPTLENHISRGDQGPTNFQSQGVTVVSGGLEVLAAGSTNAASVSFSCTKKRGAILALPVTARRQDTIVRDQFREWISTHIDVWFAFTQKLKLGIEMEDIILVTGFHRTISWSNVTFNDVKSDTKFSLGVEVPGTVGVSFNWQASNLSVQGAVHNQGPSGNLSDTQCIFIRGYRVTRRFNLLPRRIEAAAEPKPDSRGDGRKPEMEVVPIPDATEYRDPLHVLLEYIANLAPNCDLALVHDDDLDRILTAGDSSSLETLQPEVMMDYLKKTKPEIVYKSHSLPANDGTPRIESEHITVAMFYPELKSLATTDHPPSVPLLSHLSIGTTIGEESVRDDALGYPQELATPAALSGLGIHGSSDHSRNRHVGHPTHSQSIPDDERRTASPMPQTLPKTKSFVTFDAALTAYNQRTEQDLTTHPLATQLQACDTPEAILNVFLRHTAQHGFPQSGMKLIPVLNYLCAFSVTLGEGVSQCLSPAEAVFIGVDVLLVAAKDVPSSQNVYEAVYDIFKRIGFHSRELETYHGASPTPEMMDNMVEIAIEVLDILWITTKELRQGRTNFLQPERDLEDGMTKLENLTNVGVALARKQFLEIGPDNVRDDAMARKRRLRIIHDNVRDDANMKTLHVESFREKVKRTEDGKGLAGMLSTQMESGREGGREVRKPKS